MIRIGSFALALLIATALPAATVDVIDYARIFPVGVQDYTAPIEEVGLEWEAENVGWNTNYEFDTTGWQTSETEPPDFTTSDTPAYSRIRFLLDEDVVSARFTSPNEGAVQFYLNGNPIASIVGEPIDLEISEFLNEGPNLLAAKGHRTFAGPAVWFTADISQLIQIDEPPPPPPPGNGNGGGNVIPLPAALPAGAMGLLMASLVKWRRKLG